MPDTYSVREWSPGPEAPALSGGDVHVWQFGLHASSAERDALRSLLDEEELNRAGRFRLDDLARRYEVGHGRLRRVVARYLNAAAEGIRFRTGEYGKPSLVPAQNPARIELSFAHSGESALVALALDRAIGVDLEAYRARLDMDLIARRQFASAEYSKLNALPADQRQDAFYACWTRKEAYLKARGEGLRTRLKTFEVAMLPSEPPRLIASDLGDRECARWEVIPLDVGPGYAGACVVERPVRTVRCWLVEGAEPVTCDGTR